MLKMAHPCPSGDAEAVPEDLTQVCKRSPPGYH